MNNQASPGEGRKSPLEIILEHRAQVELDTPGWIETATGDRKRKANVKPLDQIEDEVTMEILAEACKVSAILEGFVDFVARKVDAYRDLAAQEHGVTWRSKIGNRGTDTVDGLAKVQISMGCLYHIDEKVQDAHALVLQCVDRWGNGADDADNVKTLATTAFMASEGGQLSRARLGMLLDFEPKNPDPEWDKAKQIIRDAIHIVSRKQSIRVAWREHQQAGWRNVPLSTIAAEAVPAKRGET